MAKVTISLNRFQYTMACDAGEEGRVQRLSASLDAKMAEMKLRTVPESQALVMLALVLCDRIEELEENLESLQKEGKSSSTKAAVVDNEQITALTETVQDLTKRLKALSV